MAKQYGVEFPERPLMATISDALGIRHFTTSNGGTVRSDFLREVLEALGGDPHGLAKEDLIEACVRAASGDFDRGLLSPGGTVTNLALQAILDGVTASRSDPVPGRSVLSDNSFESVDFDPADIRDARKRLVSERAVREGQDKFRTAVLDAYGRACAISGANSPNALEAAHITPYRGPDTNVVVNGICLRADLHRLWDSGLIAVHEVHLTVLIADALRPTTYADLDGDELQVIPRRRDQRPSTRALRSHREWAGLA